MGNEGQLAVIVDRKAYLIQSTIHQRYSVLRIERPVSYNTLFNLYFHSERQVPYIELFSEDIQSMSSNGPVDEDNL